MAIKIIGIVTLVLFVVMLGFSMYSAWETAKCGKPSGLGGGR